MTRIQHMKRAAAVTGLALCGTLVLGGFAQANAAPVNTSGTSVSQPAGHQLVVRGVVTGLSTATHKGQQVLVMQMSAGKHTLKWAVTDRTQVTDHGRPVPARAIKVGDKVTAHGSVPGRSLPSQGAIIAASTITIQ